MLQVTYTITPDIGKLLTAVDAHRSAILLTPIPPRRERQLVWEAGVNRLYALERPHDIQVTREEVEAMLTGNKRLAVKPQGVLLLSYKTVFDYLAEEWVASTRPVTLRTVHTIIDLLSPAGVTAELPVTGVEAKQLLDYLASQRDHPVIAAGIIYSQWAIWEQTPFVSPLGTFLMYVYLYKAGYNLRNLLSVHHQFSRHPREYTASLDSITAGGSSTTWLVYFLESFVRHLTTIKERIDRSVQQTQDQPFFALTDRQRSILALLDNPERTITNRDIQRTFKISQITASRELAKLATLGKIIPRGKGRSVYYIKGA